MISLEKGQLKKGIQQSGGAGKLSSISLSQHLLVCSHFAVNFYIYIWHLSEMLLGTMEAQLMLINERSS